MRHRPERKWRPAMPGLITSNGFKFPARLLVDPGQPGVKLLSLDEITAVPTNLQLQRLPT
jgi:hypothetical protein